MILGRLFGRRNAASLLTFPQLFVVCVLVFLGGASSSSQTRPSPADAAARALAAGKFDEVDVLLKGATDPRSIALIARAAIERGRYAEAEKLLTPAAASAPESDAALELGLLQMQLGRRESATRVLQGVVDRTQSSRPADLLRLALASRALGEFQDANGYFRDANRALPDDPVVNTAWGEMFLEKYELAEAQKSFQVALNGDPTNAAAMIGMARVASESNPPAAEAMVKKALEANPNSVPAYLLSAEVALDNRKRDEAHAAVNKALEINPNSLEARALDAALAFLEDRQADFNQKADEVLKINPVYGEVYRVAGDQAARNYRFDEAVSLTRKAVALDPRNVRAHADLGTQLLRVGDEPGARASLETALKGDPFNSSLVTKNQLTLLDTIDKFVTIRDGDIVMRLHPDEAAVMREHAMPLAKQALDTLSKLWDFKPTGPILIEMFPKHDDFAVRTIGLPGFIGALGACFGKVVTLDSPRARPPGEFNWSTTLWHELAHVITLQMSNNRLPRWLSEGISVWEERRARPEWGRETEVQFAAALNQGKTLKLADLNEGFSNPQLINITYYQSSLLVDHLVATYGEPALRQLLRAYGRGLETGAALQEAYKVSLDQLQVTFDAAIEKQFAPLKQALKTPEIPEDATVDQLKSLAAANPESFVVHMRLGVAQRKAGDPAGAIKTLERASQLVPVATGKDNPNVMIAAIALERNDNARAIQALDAVLKVDHSDVESARKLASLVAPLGDAARTADVYQRLVIVDPFDAQAEAALGRMALQRRDAEAAVRAFRSVLATQPPDKAAAFADLAEAYVMAGQLGEAKKQALAALEIAPSFERAQDILLKIVDGAEAGGRP